LLLALAGAHMLGFLLWQAPQRAATGTEAGRERGITWLMLPAPAVRRPALAEDAGERTHRTQREQRLRPSRTAPDPAQLPQTPPPQPQPQPQPQRAPGDADPAQQARAQQAITQPAPAPPTASGAPADPFAAAPARATADDFRQALRNSAGAADRQLRKESWNPRDKRIANDSTVLAAAIGSAYIGHDSGVTFEELSLPDGRHMTRMHMPGGGTLCAYMESNAITGGRDPFRDGVKTKISTCPR
jgi:hypothetical protein